LEHELTKVSDNNMVQLGTSHHKYTIFFWLTYLKVPVHHPSSIDSAIIKELLQTAVEHRLPYHKKYMYYSAYWIPAALSFAVVPLIPNIPLAYNAFRLYSHFKGRQSFKEMKCAPS
jgi:hypothetical protein